MLPDLGNPDEAVPAEALFQVFFQQDLDHFLLAHVLKILPGGEQFIERRGQRAGIANLFFYCN